MKLLDKKGFTLAELLLAAAILAFVLAGFLALFINCIFLNESNRNLTTAVTHAEHILEEIKDTDFDDISTDINNGNWEWNEAQVTANGLSALNTESIDTSVNGTDLLDVVVMVHWKDRGLRDRFTTLVTSIAEP